MLNFRKRGCFSRSWERQNTPGGTFWPTLFPTSTCPISRELFSWWKTLDLPGRQKRGPNRVKVGFRTAEFGLLSWSTCGEQRSLITFIFFASTEIKKLVYKWWMWAVLSARHIKSPRTWRVAGVASRTDARALAESKFNSLFYAVLGKNARIQE